jgi:hypothetical protein
MATATQGQVEAELQNRNYWQYTRLAPPDYPDIITEFPDITPITEPITIITPAPTPTPPETENTRLLMILFVGAFLLAIFPGQEGGSNV